MDVNATNQEAIWEKAFNPARKVLKKRFEVGDHVVIGKNKRLFEKGYMPNWTQEFFRITERLDRQPPTYRIEDTQGEEITGTFMEPELQKINPKDNWYLIEKVLKINPNHKYAKTVKHRILN